jgi:ABC-2 type transport system ATP-binding protein
MDAFNNYVQPQSVSMRVENPPPAADIQRVQGVTKVQYLSDRQVRVYFEGDGEITERLIAAGVQNNWRIREITLEKGLLDDIFKQLSTQTSQ